VPPINDETKKHFIPDNQTNEDKYYTKEVPFKISDYTISTLGVKSNETERGILPDTGTYNVSKIDQAEFEKDAPFDDGIPSLTNRMIIKPKSDKRNEKEQSKNKVEEWLDKKRDEIKEIISIKDSSKSNSNKSYKSRRKARKSQKHNRNDKKRRSEKEDGKYSSGSSSVHKEGRYSKDGRRSSREYKKDKRISRYYKHENKSHHYGNKHSKKVQKKRC